MSISSSSGFRSAFTLIELLVVIAIIALLAAILFPVFARARENARRSSCQSNMRQIGLGIAQYVQDYDERYPAFAREPQDGGGYTIPWQITLQTYMKSKQIFKCPSNPVALEVPSWNGTAFIDSGIAMNYSAIMSGVIDNFATSQNGDSMFGDSKSPGVAMADVNSPSTTLLVAEIRDQDLINLDADWSAQRLFCGHLQTSNYLYADGHVKALKPMATIANGVNQWTRDNTKPVTAKLRTFLQNGIANSR